MLTIISNDIRETTREKSTRSNDIFPLCIFETKQKKPNLFEVNKKTGTEIKNDKKIMRQMYYTKEKKTNNNNKNDQQTVVVCAGTSGVCISKRTIRINKLTTISGSYQPCDMYIFIYTICKQSM